MSSLRQICFCMVLSWTLGSAAQTGFMENKGQFHDSVSYEAAFNQFKIYLDYQGFTVLTYDQEGWDNYMQKFHDHTEHKHKVAPDQHLKLHAIKYRFIGANWSNPVTSNTYDANYNFFQGDQPEHWAAGVKKHAKVTFKNVYPHIDIEFEAIDQRYKYNFILHPGANLDAIQFQIEGADKLEVSSERITVVTRFGSFDEIMPISYRLLPDGTRDQLFFAYKKLGNYIGLEAPLNLQREAGHIVVDPELVFSTYAGNTDDNFGFTATYDKHGNLYAGGIGTAPFPNASGGYYPTTPGAFDVSFNGGMANAPANLSCDITISKYDSTGSNLLYATYLGGNNDEYPHSLVVTEDDQLVVFGTTYSTNFPIGTDAPQTRNEGFTDIIVTKFTADGSNIIGSTYVGGISYDGLNTASNPNATNPKYPRTKFYYADDFRGEVNLDSAGRIYVASTTRSTNFPTTSSAYQTDYNGGLEGVLFCLSPAIDSIIWSTFYGGTGDDAIYSIDYAQNNQLYFAGGTTSSDLTATDGGIQDNYAGGVTDGFIGRINYDGTQILQSTYWGTDKYDQILAAEIDKYGNVFVVGQSNGNMPIKGQVYKNDKSGQFISKFDENLENMLLSTVYGSGKTAPDITVNAFLVDECDKIFVSGWGGSINYGPQGNLKDMPVTPDALQKTTDGNDFHLAVFRKNMSDLVFATYFGGDLTDDHVDGGTSRFDKRGVIYQSVCASCPPPGRQFISDFPVTPDAFATTNINQRCSNASFKIDFGNLNRAPYLKEEWFSVIATDTLRFAYQIDDADGDTLLITADPTGLDLNQFTSFPSGTQLFVPPVNAPNQALIPFVFTPDCSIIGDTISVPIYALDIGCPLAKDSTSVLHIVVEAPPLLPPPDVICLNFLAKDALRIEWNETPSSRFFKEMQFYKVSPNQDTILLQTYTSQLGGFYVDNDVLDPRKNDYTYFFRVVNICDLLGPKSYDISSVKEHEIPVAATYLRTATVEEQRIRIEWLRSTEPDFGHYEVYKAKRDGSQTEFITLIDDIDQLYFYDEDVNVNTTSYCYQIRVSDNCGHLSAKSNIGCSIVIRGISKPFAFDLNWDDYIDWAAGVEDYELLRTIDTGDFIPIVRVDFNQRNYTDKDLDYDWGGYWYTVLAYEAAGSENATSRSNDIYLIQPPLLHVPNAFTVNGDRLNEVFSWSDVFVLDFNMQVYNRWGQKVFETTDKNADWDGLFEENGYKNSNVFIWVATYTGWDSSKHFQKGTLTILR